MLQLLVRLDLQERLAMQALHRALPDHAGSHQAQHLAERRARACKVYTFHRQRETGVPSVDGEDPQEEGGAPDDPPCEADRAKIVRRDKGGDDDGGMPMNTRVKSSGYVAKAEIAMIKVVAPNIALQIIDWAIQAHGAAGVSEDFPLAALYGYARVLRLADGPDEVHRMLIAKLEYKKQMAKLGLK